MSMLLDRKMRFIQRFRQRKVFIISAKLVYVPMMRPATPMKMKSTVRTVSVTLSQPREVFQKVEYSKMAGNARPSADKQNAPNSEMYSPKLGIAMAKTTAKYMDFSFRFSANANVSRLLTCF